METKNIDPERQRIIDEYNRKHAKKKHKAKWQEKLDMYDMIIANLLAGNSIIEPTVALDNSQLAIGFSNISSEDTLTKYFMINRFPDFLQPRLIDAIRSTCTNPSVKINFFFYSTPHRINWESPEMKNRMSVWRRYSNEHDGSVDVFAYRN